MADIFNDDIARDQEEEGVVMMILSAPAPLAALGLEVTPNAALEATTAPFLTNLCGSASDFLLDPPSANKRSSCKELDGKLMQTSSGLRMVQAEEIEGQCVVQFTDMMQHV